MDEQNQYKLELFDETDLAEDMQDIQEVDTDNLIIFSRDWTVETMLSQIDKKNIDLNPGFQRRNVWDDKKRSKLVESIMLGYPVPEVVLAEDRNRKKTYIVIDGKQRLLALYGFAKEELWNKAKLRDLKVKTNLNGKTFKDFQSDEELLKDFYNSEIRCSVITGYNDVQVLYDIFYRLNAGSVPLSSQELRQALNIGEFSNFLISATNEVNQVSSIMGLSSPDKRLNDVEVLLRCMSFIKYPESYKGNLRQFLDDSMKKLNEEWAQGEEESIRQLYDDILCAAQLITDCMTSVSMVGRKFKNSEYEKRFNRVLFELEIFYFIQINSIDFNLESLKTEFRPALERLFTSNSAFLSSFESSTKNIDNYKLRYTCFSKMLAEECGIAGLNNPFAY